MNMKQSLGIPSERVVLGTWNSEDWVLNKSFLQKLENMEHRRNLGGLGVMRLHTTTQPNGSNAMLSRNNCPSSLERIRTPSRTSTWKLQPYMTLVMHQRCSAMKCSRRVPVDPEKLQPVSGQKHGACRHVFS
jgi:hypothetical protein